MKINTKMQKNIDNSDSNIGILPEDVQIINPQNMPFADILSGQYNENLGISDITANSYSSLAIDYNYDSVSMTLKDAMFFVNLTQDGKFSIDTAPNGDFKSLMQIETNQNMVSQRAIDITNNLVSLIEKAQNTQKPVRISFDNDVSVVLKIDKHGKVSAEFIPGSIEVENYLRSNISALKQRFDEQNLPYTELFYRQNNGKQERNKRRNKGEQ